MSGESRTPEFLAMNTAGPTLADLALVAYTRVAHEGGFAMASYPAVRAWIGRVEAAFDI